MSLLSVLYLFSTFMLQLPHPALNAFFTFVYLSYLPSLPFFLICHLIFILLPLPTWPIFMLPNCHSFILLFLLMVIPFCHSSCILGTIVGFPCFSVPWSCCWDSQSMKVFPSMCIHALRFTDGILEAQKQSFESMPPYIKFCFALTTCRASFLGIKLQHLAERDTVDK